ncbi:MFS transporter [Picrophilus oshimae]|uniref:Nitrate/nitrite transporter NarK n=1 Tax=Picrophilus torridus (strain ATCC 700027 / DSM 9790 / JCM 10055 / NBRC 100828 / KAW 2/3) TaxID=1122961 RepID=A0A8G2L8I6_PICTO|nr:MFS transporter [Picrophilus oshimae]SMD31499.1 Nitrate/nitrite transporter NarK [Picrophilus oshimae DSM 9789]
MGYKYYNRTNYQFRSLVFTSLAHFTNDGNFLLFPTLITYYKFIPGVSITFLGIMAIVYNLLSGLLGTPIGRLADKINRDSFLIFIGIASEGISVLIFALAFLYMNYASYIIFLGSVLLGFGQAFYHPIGASILSFTYGKEKAPGAMGINGSFGSLGRAALPSIIVYSMAFLNNFNGLLLIFAYTMASAFIILSGLSFFNRSKYSEAETYNDKFNDNKIKSAPSIKLYYRFLLVLVALVFIRSMFLTGTVTFVPDYLDDIFKSKTLMGDILTLSFLSAVFGQPYFGSMVKKYGGKFTILITSLISTVFFALFLIYDNIIYITLVYLVYVFAAFSGFPVLLGYVGQVIPREFSTQSNALVWSFGNIVGGSAGIALITGFNALKYPLHFSLSIMLIFAVVSLVMVPLLPSKNKGEKVVKKDKEPGKV